MIIDLRVFPVLAGRGEYKMQLQCGGDHSFGIGVCFGTLIYQSYL